MCHERLRLDEHLIQSCSMCPITKAPAKYSMYKIEFTDAALADLKSFKKHEQNEIIDGIEANLTYEPTVETRNRSPLRPNQTAEWKLRLGNFRVYYDVDTVVRIVSVEAIGLKVGNLVLFRGKARGL